VYIKINTPYIAKILSVSTRRVYDNLVRLNNLGFISVVRGRSRNHAIEAVALKPEPFGVYMKNDKLNIRDIYRKTSSPPHKPIVNLKECSDLREPIMVGRKSIFLREPIVIGRKPIQVKERPVRINLNAKKYSWLTESQKLELLKIAHLGMKVVENKLKRYKDAQSKEFSPQENECLNDFIPYYENLICDKIGVIEYSLLNNRMFPKRSRNWTALFKIYTLCIEKGWDYKLYLESQFDSFHNWSDATKSSLRYPAPNMLYSDRAVIAYENYIYDKETSYRNEGYAAKAKNKDIGDYKEEVKKRVDTTINVILQNMKQWTSQYCTVFDRVDENKYNILEVMSTYSVYCSAEQPINPCIEYMVFVPGIQEFMEESRGISQTIDKKIDNLIELMNNKQKMKIVTSIVHELNSYYGMPGFVDINRIPEIMWGASSKTSVKP
jgi:hypothetical protein